MTLPSQPVTLTPEQIAGLNQKLATMRHNVNNHLALVIAAAELIRRKPESIERMCNGLAEKPHQISEAIGQFSQELETALGIERH
jgi:hypothetical protein